MNHVDLENAVLLILANKQDVDGAKSPEYIEDRLQLNKLRCEYRFQPCSVVGKAESDNDGEGVVAETPTEDKDDKDDKDEVAYVERTPYQLYEGLNWLCKALRNHPQRHSSSSTDS